MLISTLCIIGKHARATPDDDAVRKIDSASSARQEKLASHSDPAMGRSAGFAGADADAKVPNKNRESRKVDEASLAKLVAEENANKSKFPHYPGLERWQLIEKMGDGAFSNVYRARDTQGQYGEVAIKVVRKYEMNNMQVSCLALFHYVCQTGCCFCLIFAIIFLFCLLPPHCLLHLHQPDWFFAYLGQPFTPRLQKAAKSCRGALFHFSDVLLFCIPILRQNQTAKCDTLFSHR